MLIFGQAWYKTLPGVFTHTSDLALAEIMSYQIDHKELEAKISLLQTRMGDGVVDSGFLGIVKDFDLERNARKVTHSLKMILQRAPLPTRIRV